MTFIERQSRKQITLWSKNRRKGMEKERCGKNFKKVMAANRGEIAIRIFRACCDLGRSTVAIYSKEDEYNVFRTKADESYMIGENKSPLGAYLDIGMIIDIAKKHRCV